MPGHRRNRLRPAAPLASAEPAFGPATSNRLFAFDTATPGSVKEIPITGLAANRTVRGIDFRSATGEVYGLAAQTGVASGSLLETYRTHPRSGSATR